MHGSTQAFCQTGKADRRLIPSAVTDTFDVIQNVTAVEYRTGSPKVNASIFGALAVIVFAAGCGVFPFFCSSVKLQNGGCQRGADTGGEWLI